MRETHISYSISLLPSDCIHIHFWQNIYKNKNCLLPQSAEEITRSTHLKSPRALQTDYRQVSYLTRLIPMLKLSRDLKGQDNIRKNLRTSLVMKQKNIPSVDYK